MLINHMGEAVPEHIDHINCLTQVKMDDLWICLANAPNRCPHVVTYGPMKYCTYKDHAEFAARTKKGH